MVSLLGGNNPPILAFYDNFQRDIQAVAKLSTNHKYSSKEYTPWKFNIAPENILSQKESSLPGRTVKLREGTLSITG